MALDKCFSNGLILLLMAKMIMIIMFQGFSISALPSSTFISDAAFDSQPQFIGHRILLQAKKGCSVNLEFLNYTIITSRCKGPNYPPSLCCSAFKELACPYADELNDLTTECASILFSYINIYGRYPPALFASECREGKRGLECSARPPSMSANNAKHQVVCYTLLMLIALFLVSLFMLA